VGRQQGRQDAVLIVLQLSSLKASPQTNKLKIMLITIIAWHCKIATWYIIMIVQSDCKNNFACM
jgi:hypothetical protein